MAKEKLESDLQDNVFKGEHPSASTHPFDQVAVQPGTAIKCTLVALVSSVIFVLSIQYDWTGKTYHFTEDEIIRGAVGIFTIFIPALLIITSAIGVYHALYPKVTKNDGFLSIPQTPTPPTLPGPTPTVVEPVQKTHGTLKSFMPKGFFAPENYGGGASD